MADEKHFNHSFISPSFAPECPVLQGVMGGMVKCSEITDCGKSEQNPASCYYLLVVKLVVTGEMVTTKDFYYLPGNSLINGCIVL